MAPYIEFLGAPGVGKSTLLTALVRRSAGAGWVSYGSALRARPRLDGGLRRGAETAALWFVGQPDRRLRDVAAEAYAVSRPELAAVLWSNLARRYTGDRVGARLQRVASWFDRAGAVSLVAGRGDMRPVVFDEALLHPDYFPPDASEAEIDAFLDRLDPLPMAAVHLDAPGEIGMARLGQRANRTVTLSPLSSEEMLAELNDLRGVCEKLSGCLRRRGIPVLPVSAVDPTADLAVRVASFLARCCGPS